MMKIKLLLIVFMVTSLHPSWAVAFNEKLETLRGKVASSKQILNDQSLDNVDVVKQHLTFMVDIDKNARELFTEKMSDVEIRELVGKIDHLNTNHLKAILALHEWIIISKFGEEADQQAWLLMQHADHDPAFQVKCLLILEKLFPLKETNKKNYAYLYDRVAPGQGLKQRYGTQAKIKGDHFELLPFEGSLTDVNNRRREVGLGTVEEYLETLKLVYRKAL